MQDQLSPEQSDALKSELAMIPQLLALPSVNKHDTRFEGEVALVAPREALEGVAAIVEEHLGEPAKAAGTSVPADLAGSAMVKAMGGLRGNQTLYAKAVGEELTVYVAFWPWGGGARITIKVGVHGT